MGHWSVIFLIATFVDSTPFPPMVVYAPYTHMLSTVVLDKDGMGIRGILVNYTILPLFAATHSIHYRRRARRF